MMRIFKRPPPMMLRRQLSTGAAEPPMTASAKAKMPLCAHTEQQALLMQS
jgi:hypothetical protein